MTSSLLHLLLPELLLIVAACALFIVGLSSKPAARRFAPVLAIFALSAVFALQAWTIYRGEAPGAGSSATKFDAFGGINAEGAPTGTVRVADFAQYIKLITAGVGAILILLAWPTDRQAMGNSSAQYGNDAGEFFALMLLSLAGVMMVAAANDIMLLFLGIELASIPTYILVSISRRSSVAQEAGVKYFFLGAMAAAVMLMGFSYLYGTTGSTNLHDITRVFHPAGDWNSPPKLSAWQTLAVLMLVGGFAFKMAAVPLHFYAGDVYQGAATPVTAFLSFVPKATGFVALIKLLAAVGGPNWVLPEPLVKPGGTGLLFILAILTMTVGNVLGLLQYNVKRVLAYSSIAHTGYMLVALAALGAQSTQQKVNNTAGLQAVLFYLAAYGVMNVGAFGVLMMLPSKDGKGSAETFEDLSGQGRRHVGLGLAMATCCFSLTGIPLTVGFLSKLFVIKPALDAAAAPLVSGVESVKTAMVWLVVITMINAAISAAYYLRIVATMFLRGDELAASVSHGGPGVAAPVAPGLERTSLPIRLAVGLSVAGILLFGMIPPAIQLLNARATRAVNIEGALPAAAAARP